MISIDAPSRTDARIAAIRRIWEILQAEKAVPPSLDRRIEIKDESGAVVDVVTFVDALFDDCRGSC
jgi:hypothetical protein